MVPIKVPEVQAVPGMGNEGNGLHTNVGSDKSRTSKVLLPLQVEGGVPVPTTTLNEAKK